MRKIIKRKEPTPLLIVLASFDPSGEGVDHFDPEKPELLTDPLSPYYGEQWTTTDPQEIYNTFFGEGGLTCSQAFVLDDGSDPAEYEEPVVSFVDKLIAFLKGTKIWAIIVEITRL